MANFTITSTTNNRTKNYQATITTATPQDIGVLNVSRGNITLASTWTYALYSRDNQDTIVTYDQFHSVMRVLANSGALPVGNVFLTVDDPIGVWRAVYISSTQPLLTPRIAGTGSLPQFPTSDFDGWSTKTVINWTGGITLNGNQGLSVNGLTGITNALNLSGSSVTPQTLPPTTDLPSGTAFDDSVHTRFEFLKPAVVQWNSGGKSTITFKAKRYGVLELRTIFTTVIVSYEESVLEKRGSNQRFSDLYGPNVVFTGTAKRFARLQIGGKGGTATLAIVGLGEDYHFHWLDAPYSADMGYIIDTRSLLYILKAIVQTPARDYVFLKYEKKDKFVALVPSGPNSNRQSTLGDCEALFN
jgi:hypothetical protein